MCGPTCIFWANLTACSRKDYVEKAKEQGYAVLIVEIKCPDDETRQQFNSRSDHNVPEDKSVEMMRRWHVDQVRKTPS
jgi:hypothetical protein